MDASGMTRREVLGRAAAIAALPTIAAPAAGSAHDGHEATPAPTSGVSLGGAVAPGESTQALPYPEVIASEGGVLTAILRPAPATIEMGAPQPVKTWAYNGMVPGPTWEIKPGDVLKFDVVNGLPAIHEDHGERDMMRPHAWTTTNIHTHGLHVSPEGNSDNVFLEIAPGESQSYEIAVPEDHPAGLFWYHPHKHGGVCQQVRAGLAGAIVVRGDIDEVPEIAAAKEHLLVFQAIEVGEDYSLQDPIPYPQNEEAFYPRKHILYTANGILNPTITMYPGEVQRLRMLNAAEGKFMHLALEGHDLYQIAWDGLTMDAPEPASKVLVSSGNRLEALVKAGAPGTYQMIVTPASSQHPTMPGMGTPPATKELIPQPILTIVVEGEGPEMALPAALPAYDPEILPIAKKRDFTYSVERGPDEIAFYTFGINGEPFDPANPPYQMKLNTAEEWTLTNARDPKYPEHAHNFHIHVNPFKVTHINGEPLARPFWRDTFILTGINGDSFTFVHNFTDFTGRTVEHCHVLSHEDLGMMEMLEILP
ncbi:MAG: multicopper oxidase domain-containing protein [Thermomicrobiales bacterium]